MDRKLRLLRDGPEIDGDALAIAFGLCFSVMIGAVGDRQHVQREGDACATAPAGADGLTLLPYLDGERTPNLPRGTGVAGGVAGLDEQGRHLPGPGLRPAGLELVQVLQVAEEMGPHQACSAEVRYPYPWW